ALCPSLEALAEAYYSMGEYEEAKALHERVLPIKERCFGRTHQNVADTLNRLADIFQAMGLYEKAESFHHQSLTMREHTLGYGHVVVGNSYNNLGLFYLALGDLHRSRQSFSQALRIQKPIYGPRHSEVATIYHNLALIFRSLGQSKRAHILAKYALRIREQVFGKDHPIVAVSLLLLGQLCGHQKQYGQAETLYRRAIAISSRTKGPTHLDVSRMLNSLGIASLFQNNYDRAKSYFRRSLKILQAVMGKDHVDGRFPLTNLAAVYRNSGQVKKALTNFKQGLELENKYIETVFRTAVTEQQQLQCILSLGQNYDAALSLVVRKFQETPSVIKAALAWILLRKGIICDAAATKKRLRSHHSPSTEFKISALRTLRAKHCQLLLEPPDRFQKEWKSYRNRYRYLKTEIERIERLLKSEGVDTTDGPRPEHIDFPVLCRVLPRETALVEYVKIVDWTLEGKKSGCSRYLAFVVSAQHQLRLFDLGLDWEIEPLISQVLRGIQDEIHCHAEGGHSIGTRHLKTSFQNLYQRLWSPLKDCLANSKNVFICPDGLLNLLPFSALLDEGGHSLIDQYPIAYLTSGRELLGRGRTRPSAATELLLVANPDFGPGGKFSPLPGTVAEAECIPPLLPGAHAHQIVLQEQAATKQAVIRTNMPRVMHLATHGYFLDEAPQAMGDPYEKLLLRSGLVFAGANRPHQDTSFIGDDGHLTALEVTGMDLQGTELAVLSACSTGIGEVVNGEGVFGLRRAFSLAGVKNLMMSLWNITDEDAPRQMVSFYKYFQNLPPAMALRQAQLETIHALQDEMGHAPIVLWAPFIMQGPSAFDRV
ncbi:MAG: CHAT domain-containing protein, partial [Nitrospira sp.]|nr:CHAT domain-containing protein [Nitrospira sp.]